MLKILTNSRYVMRKLYNKLAVKPPTTASLYLVFYDQVSLILLFGTNKFIYRPEQVEGDIVNLCSCPRKQR